VHEEVLLRLATLGAALPPLPETSSQGVAAPPSPGSHSGSDALALQLAQCNALAAEVAALDDFSRGALSAMGRLGQLYDARMAAAGGGKAAPLLTAVYSHSAPMPGALKHTIGTAGAGGWWLLWCLVWSRGGGGEVWQGRARGWLTFVCGAWACGSQHCWPVARLHGAAGVAGWHDSMCATCGLEPAAVEVKVAPSWARAAVGWGVIHGTPCSGSL
jgi:hypothetical protein